MGMSDHELPLFQTSTTPKVISVSDLTQNIKALLEGNFEQVWIRGEISNLKMASSGHVYFSLKDEGSQISAVIFGWGRRTSSVKFDLKEGLEVICRANVTVYPARGNYQIIIDHIEPLGAGALTLAFEQLKKKLESEGLFDRARKREIARYPRKIVVITSTQAAAFQDVLTVLARRAPWVDVLLIPSLVQGADAPEHLVRAVRVANKYQLGDVILLTRGGGSIEDLWAFNNEILARTLAESTIPVVSAVGHEVDFTIADFVADVRAPTPSAGAELITQYWVQLNERSHQLNLRLRQAIAKEVQLKKRNFEHLVSRLRTPKEVLQEKAQRVDDLAERLSLGIRSKFNRNRLQLSEMSGRLRSPEVILENKKTELKLASAHLFSVMVRRLESTQFRFQSLAVKLDLLSPLGVLTRGYAIVRTPEGKVVRSVDDVDLGEKIKIRLNEGEIHARVDGVF